MIVEITLPLIKCMVAEGVSRVSDDVDMDYHSINVDGCGQSNVDVSVDACLVMLGIYAKAGIRGH